MTITAKSKFTRVNMSKEGGPINCQQKLWGAHRFYFWIVRPRLNKECYQRSQYSPIAR